MSTSTLTIERPRHAWLSRVADYVELTKPRISVLVLVTVAVAYCFASWGQPDPRVMLHVLAGTLLVAASASALNQWLERRQDALMERTAERPLAAARLSRRETLVFATLTIAAGVSYLAVTVGPGPAFWGLVTWLLYVWVYTPLKRITPWNTAIGAIAGAAPVLIGWSAAGDVLTLRASSLFLILFLWQFPHFMAIAWMYRHEYRRAGMKMLPVVDPTGRRAGIQAVAAALALLPVSLLPGMFAPGLGGTIYVIAAFVLGVIQLGLAIAFCVKLTDEAARRLLRASLVYLPTLMLLVLVVVWG